MNNRQIDELAAIQIEVLKRALLSFSNGID